MGTWSELPVLLLQNLVCIILRHRFGGRARAAARSALARDMVGFAGVALLMARLPSQMLPILSLWTVPLAVLSYGRQVADGAMNGAIAVTTPLVTTVLLRWLSSLVRIMTTMAFLGGDRNVLANHIVGLGGCTVLLYEMFWFHGAGGVSRLRTRKALYSQLLRSWQVAEQQERVGGSAASGSGAGGDGERSEQQISWRRQRSVTGPKPWGGEFYTGEGSFLTWRSLGDDTRSVGGSSTPPLCTSLLPGQARG